MLVEPVLEAEVSVARRGHQPAQSLLLGGDRVTPDRFQLPRPRLQSHGDYILGVFLVPVAVKAEDRIYYQEIDLIATTDVLVSVSKTPPGEQPFDAEPAKDACRTDEDVGMFVYHLVDEIAERYLDLIDDLDDEIDELEDLVPVRPTVEVGHRLRELRENVRGIRRTLNDPIGIMASLRYVGLIARAEGRLDEALKLHREAVDMALSHDLKLRGLLVGPLTLFRSSDAPRGDRYEVVEQRPIAS